MQNTEIEADEHSKEVKNEHNRGNRNLIDKK